jgi:hypothetical protein
MRNVNSALLSLYGQKFSAGKFEVELFGEVKMDWEVIGKYKVLDKDVAKYHDGKRCWENEKNAVVDLKLVCANETKLIYVKEVETCKFDGVFATPAVCSEATLAWVKTAEFEDVQSFAEILGIQ